MITAGLPSRRPSPVALFGGDVPALLYSDPRKGGDGKTRINPDKLHAKWGWIAATLNNQFPITVGANATVNANLTVGDQASSLQGDFEASTLLLQSTARLAVTAEVRTPTFQRILSNINIPSNLMFGTSQFPGLLPMSIFCLPKSAWFFTLQDLSGSTNTVSPVIFGRRYDECSEEFTAQLHRRAEFLRWIHPYWIGPRDPSTAGLTGPEITIPAGNVTPQSRTLTFQIPSSAGFLMTALLDDSTAVGGAEPVIVAQFTENVSGRALANLPAQSTAAGGGMLGIDWNLMACPTATVTGIVGGAIRAASLLSPQGGYTHLIPRNTQVTIKYTSFDANIITLRPALFGYLVYAEEAPERKMSRDFAANTERRVQADEWLRRMGLTSASIFEEGA